MTDKTKIQKKRETDTRTVIKIEGQRDFKLPLIHIPSRTSAHIFVNRFIVPIPNPEEQQRVTKGQKYKRYTDTKTVKYKNR